MKSSWINVDIDSDFSIQNLPFGIFSMKINEHNISPRVGVAIGDFILDLFALHQERLLDSMDFDTSIFGDNSLNRFMSLHPRCWSATRCRIYSLLIDDEVLGDKVIRSNPILQAKVLVNRLQATMHLPAVIGDYTDFYSSREHATNVGIMFRGPDNALQPNWLHLPVGYHGRSSSVVVSGADVVRPVGQILPPGTSTPIFSKCQALDFELEIAAFVGYSPDGSDHANRMGSSLSIESATQHIFGVVLMNDWSARDIQSFEYVPLGPFTAKNFCTSISPWVVTLEALDQFRCASSAGAQQLNPSPLPYLQDPDYGTSFYDIQLQVSIRPDSSMEPASVISKTNSKYLYWSFKQQLVHHSITGCPMRAGDLLGSGTISGTTDDSLGSMLELSWKGSRDVALQGTSLTRKYLQDGDTVEIGGYCRGTGYRVGFGTVIGKILPSFLDGK